MNVYTMIRLKLSKWIFNHVITFSSIFGILYVSTSMGTQRCQGYSKLPLPFTRTIILLLKSKNNAKTFSLASQVPLSKFEANQSMGSWVLIERTYKQTDKQKLKLYIHIDVLVIFIYSQTKVISAREGCS